ncbi:MAG: TRAP transporter substrate-binding protein [Deltaproteobacteria bacterium]|nr:TRAP transporter substrate-binding protein [Deltaproteobacteria bacterium]MBW2120227.1 TRAP transporter substrate-binding protein [Deltaproteobacteria bacterium]
MKKLLLTALCVLFLLVVMPLHGVAGGAVTLKMAMYQPANHAFVRYYTAMMPMVEKITGGKIKIKIYHSATLLRSTEMDVGINKGVADIGFSYPPMMSASIPFLGLTDLPGIWRDTKGFNDAFDNGLTELYEEAYYQAGLTNLKVIGLTNIGFWYPCANTKKEVRVPADMKGLKIKGMGRMHVKYVDACGGTGVNVPIAECYESIERGVIDGCTGFTSNFVSWKLMEPCKYFVDFAPGLGPMMLIVNKKSLERKVPKELREPLLEILTLLVKAHRGVMLADDAYNHDIVMPQHMKYYRPNAEERKAWIEAGRPLVEEWLSKTGALGKKAMEIVEKYNQR